MQSASGTTKTSSLKWVVNGMAYLNGNAFASNMADPGSIAVGGK